MKKVLIDSNVVFDICNAFNGAGLDVSDNNISGVESFLNRQINLNGSVLANRINSFFQKASKLNFDLINDANNFKNTNDAFYKLVRSNSLTFEQRIQVVAYMEKNFNLFVSRLNKLKKYPEKLNSEKVKPTKKETKKELRKIKKQLKFLTKQSESYNHLTKTFFDLTSQLNAIKVYSLAKDNEYKLVVNKVVESEVLSHIVGTREYFYGNEVAKRQLEEKLRAKAKKEGKRFSKRKFLKEKKWLLTEKEILEQTDVYNVFKDCEILYNSEEMSDFINNLANKLQDNANLSKYKNRLDLYGDAIIALTSYISGYDLVTNNSKDFMTVNKGLQTGNPFTAWVNKVLKTETITQKNGNDLFVEFEQEQDRSKYNNGTSFNVKNIPKHNKIEQYIYDEYNNYLVNQGKDKISITEFRHGNTYAIKDFIETYNKVYKKSELFDAKVVPVKNVTSQFTYKKQEALISKNEYENVR